MQQPVTRTDVLRFGVFEVNLQSEELRKSGIRIKLPGQSFQILRILLQRPGVLVTREELHRALWPENTYVDFDHGLNAAVTRLRDALGDSADSPRFVETLPRRGYRFIGTLHPVNGNSAVLVAESNVSAIPVAEPAQVHFWKSRKLAVIAGIGALVVVALAMIGHRTLATPPNLTVTPFTSLPGQELNPSFSPDGTRIVFAWDGDPPPGRKGFDLYVKEIGSEHLLRLTHNADNWLVPSWSPDGRFIVFTRSAQGRSGVYMIPALGGDERQLKKDTGDYNSLSLSADGRYLAYPETLPSTLSRVALLDMQTMAAVPLALPTCLMSRDPAFSPKGQTLAFACTPSWGITDIYVTSDIGAAPRKLARVLGSPNGLAWTADGCSLVLGVSRGRADLWRVDTASGNAEPILVGSQGGSPAISLHGNLLAFEQRTETSNIWRLDLNDPTKTASRLIASTRYEQNAKYSPDGQRVLFESSRSGFAEIWMSRADGGDVLQLTHFEGPLTGSPAWAPDSAALFSIRATPEFRISTSWT
ncbi:MAG TPA: winged helix-turn-helix domain-containing protein [Terriglobales bacterium]|nr:winged helix-turn-helix domain-containing protein [Terriglobales bacterium]